MSSTGMGVRTSFWNGAWTALCVGSIVIAGCDPAPMTGEDAGHARDAASDAGPDAGVVDLDSGGSDAGTMPDAGMPDAGCVCDDGIACTEDSCQADGSCRFEPVHTACPDGEFCRPGAGCEAGPACAIDADCTRPDPCVTVRCDPARRQCVYSTLDGDGDGYPPFVCRGTDCDDSRADVNPAVTEDVCDGIDADCSGSADPIDAPGCATGETCDGASCVCASPMTVCTLPFTSRTVCVDLQSDNAHCGGCNEGCYAVGEACIAGVCRCPAGQTACGGACVDTSSNQSHCGACRNACGEATCIASSCQCPSGTVLCAGWAGARECATLATDPRHCSACGARCFTASECTGGACELSAGPVLRGYALHTIDNTADPSTRIAAIDPRSGAAAVIQVDERSGVEEAPTRGIFLYTGGTHVVRYRPDGTFHWATQLSMQPGSIAYGNGHIYVSGYSTLSSGVSIGGTSFPRNTGSRSVTVVAELSEDTGQVVASVVIQSATVYWEAPWLDADPAGELVLAATFAEAIDWGGGSTLPASSTNMGVIARLGPGLVHRASWRQPVGSSGIQLDPLGNVVAHGSLLSPPVSFGGAPIGTTGTRPDYVVRYAPDGTHLSSWAMPTSTRRVLARTDGVLVSRQSDTAMLYHYRYLGEGADVPSTPPAGWLSTATGVAIDPWVEDGGSIYASVSLRTSVTTTVTIAGRSILVGGRGVAGVLRLDSTTLELVDLGMIDTQGTSIFQQVPGEIFGMETTASRTLRITGRLVGPLGFGSRTLMAGPQDFGTYLADIVFAL